MARKTTAAQPSFFRRDIPRMPDGYYASGPNPNLARFVAQHATPYDPATDTYDVPPFDQPITIDKRKSESMDLHIYWSKKPHDAIRQYIRHYTQPGDLSTLPSVAGQAIVLDPFCSSGGTALAALMEGCAAIAIDLSPAATFITKNYCTPVDVDELQRAFEALQAAVKPELDWLYETRCDRCDGRATTAYTVYSYIFRCPRCLERVALFDCAVGPVANRPYKYACPFCYERGIEEEISTRGERFDPVPVLVSYECQEGCKPKRGERRHNDPDPKKRAFFEEYDLGKLREIEAKPIPHWVPPHRMMNVESDTARWGDKWRAGTSNFRTVAELFTRRNLWALAALLKDIHNVQDERDRDALLFGFTSILLKASRMMAHNNDGIGRVQKGTYYIPQIEHDVNVWRFMAEAIGDLKAGFAEMTVPSTDLLISTADATALDCQTASIDYVFTDPPYAEKVQYGELNFVWEAWLGFDTHWHDCEIIVNEARGITEEEWARLMRQAMSECHRVLKPGRWISLCYHDTSEGTWELVQDIMTEAGFIPETSSAAVYIDTATKTTNQYFADKVTKRDLVINFRKPWFGEVSQIGNLRYGDATFAENATAILAEALERHPGASADRLHDELVSRMVRRGEFERHNFEALLAHVAEPVREPVMRNLLDPAPPDLFGGHEVVRWYLKDSADHLDEAESRKEAAAAARLEKFMHAKTFEVSQTSKVSDGTHYSDLFEQYLPIADKPRRLLADWLPEYFIKTADGTWRPPADDEERSQLAALRTTGSLRHVKRFAAALLESVPPAERDRSANVATAADWLRQCRRAGLYELGASDL